MLVNLKGESLAIPVKYKEAKELAQSPAVREVLQPRHARRGAERAMFSIEARAKFHGVSK